MSASPIAPIGQSSEKTTKDNSGNRCRISFIHTFVVSNSPAKKWQVLGVLLFFLLHL